jgi:predicted ATPase
MIKEIKIENFKSIQSLNLELGRLNVFIGANGSGKSNILEAIAFASASIEDKLDKEFLSNRGIRYTEPKFCFNGFTKQNLQDKIQISLLNDDKNPIPTNIHLSNIGSTYSRWKIKIDDKVKKIGNYILDKTELSEAWEAGSEDEDISSFTSNIHMRMLRKQNSDLIKFLIFAPENSVLRNFEDESAIEPLGIKGEGLFKHIVYIFKEKPDLFKKINDHLQLLDWFDGFEIPNDLMFTERRIKIKDQYLEDGLQYFDQRSANEGFLYLLFYLTLFISDKTPKFFAIDNIDNAMNPKMGDELVHLLAKLSKEHDKQVILTTHNPSVLDGLDLSDDDQRLFVISRNKKGHTKALRVPYRETEERLSYLFIRGSIGGLPKNF